MGLNPKQKRFALEYPKILNATQAVIRAGYSEKTAYSQGQRLLKHVEVQAEIQRAAERAAERAEVGTADVIRRWSEIALADPNDLVSVIVGSCRYCHGEGHQYQWRDEREFDEAQEAHFALPDDKRDPKKAPVLAGGFGYRFRRKPNIDCPQCDGFGKKRVELKDTTDLGPQAAALYAGAKQTMAGVEVKMQDQAAALEKLARHLGMFVDRVEHSGEMVVNFEGPDTDL